MKREPLIENWYNSKDWTTQYKVKYYSKEKNMITYTDTSWNQYTVSLSIFTNKVAKYEKHTKEHTTTTTDT